MKRLIYPVLLLLLLAACNPAEETLPTLAPTVAASATCEEIVATALNQTSDACDTTERNQACYGNGAIAAQLRQADAPFEQPGQRIQIGTLESMQLAALNTDTGEWGVALLRVQANLPDTLPGQNVTLLIFGNTEFRTVESGANPQAFYFQSGVGYQLTCAAAPPDGLLIQTPEGVANIEFNLNNVQIQLGSTAFIEAAPENEMIVNVIEGQAIVTANDVSETIPAGARTRVPLDAQGLAAGQPSAPEPYNAAAFQTLPLRPLQRDIEIAPPIAGSSTFAPIGFQIQDSIGQAGEFDEFTLNVQAGQQAYFDGLAENTDIRWNLTAPDGTTAFNQQVVQFDYDTLTFEQAGEYTLTVAGLNDTTGVYEFRIWDVPPPQPQSITIVSGDSEELVSGTIETPGVSDIFTFEAEVGQQVYFDGEAGDTDIRWTLAAPDGTDLFRTQVVQFDFDTFVLEQGGLYTLTVDGLTDATGEYAFKLLDVPPAQPESTTIISADNETFTSGIIETSGVVDIFTFEAQAGQQVYFDGESGDTNIRWTLAAPDGTELFSTQVVQFDFDTFVLEQTGTHTLTIDGLTDTTGEYSFRLLDVPIAEPVQTGIVTIESEKKTGGTIESPGTTDIFTFDAAAGQQIYFDGLLGDTNIRWTLTAPDETVLFNAQVVQFDVDTFLLEQTGTYTLTIDGLNDVTGNYEFRLLDVPVSEPVAITIATNPDAMISGAIETPGVIDVYTFTAESGQQVVYDGEADNTNIRWTLTAPDDTVVFNTQVVQFEFEPFTLEQSGVYTMTIDGLGDAVGEYRFQLRAE
jgi:hypothetical protein